ncbi:MULTISPECIES: retron St85 family RNA-directed DNA polymerase [Sphingobacterium]|uniref:retron St85 family RNA-directed DNA polymerase n=1 Tax=Sphingobacterium TaxID=28453 RepID=UPI00257AC6ED|nr:MULTISPECIES: retron St85 family RNA-directed DNA polymerase [Sphingobacterium]
MEFLEYSEKFKEKAYKAGYTEKEINEYLAYAKVLIENKIPVIFDASHLASLTGYSTRYITRAALYTKHFYRSFQIKKRNGKLRTINEPLPSLKEIQIWINQNILQELKPSKFAKAYLKNKNTVDNAKYHKGKKFVLCLDLTDFFPSISAQSIENLFIKWGYTKGLSNLFSRLCCLNGALSQGSPTSPMLSNLIMLDFDERIGKFAVDHNIRYTRYADDLTFSFNDNIDYHLIISKVQLSLNEIPFCNFRLNPNKTQFLTQDTRQIVTGVVVNDKLQAPKVYRKEIRQEIFYIRKFGLKSHLIKINEERGNYLYHILGKINYCLSLNKDDKEMKNYKQQITMLLKNSTI